MTLLNVAAAGPYNALFLASIILAGWLAFRAGRREGRFLDEWALSLAAWVTGGIIGSALLSWLVQGQPGGKTFVGAVAGSLLALALVSRILGRSVAGTFDHFAVAIPAGAVVVRIGCFIAGCCGGLPTTLPWGVAGDSPGLPSVHPVQLYDAALSGLLAALLHRNRGRLKRPGDAALTMVAGLAAIRFVLQFVRDSHDGARGLDITQWGMAMILAAIIVHLATRGDAAWAPVEVRPRTSAILAIATTLSIVSILAMPILSALEGGVVTMAMMVACGVVLTRLQAAVRLASPAGAMALLMFQQAPADSTPARRSFEIGLGGSRSRFSFQKVESHSDDDCNSTVTRHYRRRHELNLGIMSAGVRVDRGTQGFGVRAKLFQGADYLSAAEVTVGAPPPRPEAHSEPMRGVALMLDVDRKWAGFTAGLATGSWPSIEIEHLPSHGGTAPTGLLGLRAGWMQHLYLSLETSPIDGTGIDLPSGLFGATLVDNRGDSYRLASAGETGTLYQATVLLPRGFVLSGMVSQASSSAARVMLGHRFEFSRK